MKKRLKLIIMATLNKTDIVRRQTMTPTRQALPLFTHHWSGGPACGWGGQAGSTQPHCRMPQYARLYNFGKNAWINTVEILIPYTFFWRLPLCNCILISYTTIKCHLTWKEQIRSFDVELANCWAKQRRMVVRGGIKWGEVVRPMVAASPNCGHDPQWHYT